MLIAFKEALCAIASREYRAVAEEQLPTAAKPNTGSWHRFLCP
jgi:hypothetical protein